MYQARIPGEGHRKTPTVAEVYDQLVIVYGDVHHNRIDFKN